MRHKTDAAEWAEPRTEAQYDLVVENWRRLGYERIDTCIPEETWEHAETGRRVTLVYG